MNKHEIVSLKKEWRSLICAQFSTEEFELVCGDIGLDIDQLVGKTKIFKVRSLIEYCVRDREAAALVATLQEHRPKQDWHRFKSLDNGVGLNTETHTGNSVISMSIGENSISVSGKKRSRLRKGSKSETEIQSISLEQQKLIDELRKEFREANRRKFTFLLIGRAGVGKSSTINSLLGKKVRRVGRFKRVTRVVKAQEAEVNGIRFGIVDTPGLADTDDIDAATDKKYLAKIKKAIPRLDCILFVTRLDETRIRSDEMRTIRLISEYFGKPIWNRTVIVFTFSDKVSSKRYKRDFSIRTRILRSEIAKHTGVKIAHSIPSVAVANDEDSGQPIATPDGKQWLGELYTQVFLRVSGVGAVAFYLATKNRLVAKPKVDKKSSPPKNSPTRAKSSLRSNSDVGVSRKLYDLEREVQKLRIDTDGIGNRSGQLVDLLDGSKKDSGALVERIAKVESTLASETIAKNNVTSPGSRVDNKDDAANTSQSNLLAQVELNAQKSHNMKQDLEIADLSEILAGMDKEFSNALDGAVDSKKTDDVPIVLTATQLSEIEEHAKQSGLYGAIVRGKEWVTVKLKRLLRNYL